MDSAYRLEGSGVFLVLVLNFLMGGCRGGLRVITLLTLCVDYYYKSLILYFYFLVFRKNFLFSLNFFPNLTMSNSGYINQNVIFARVLSISTSF